MERLSALDAEFLHLEDGIVHMHIAGACIFDDPPPSVHEIEALVASKLDQIPRYRQRVRSVPFGLGRPIWVDDPHFDLGYHIRHTALPAPGDDEGFCRLMGRLMSVPLDRERPLWEAWLVEGLEGGRWALVFKVHHCMVDGIAGVELLTVMLDLEADTAIVEEQPWTPQAEAPGARKVLDAWGGLAADVLDAARSIPASIAHPAAAVRSTLSTLEGGALFAASPSADAHTFDRRPDWPTPGLGSLLGEPCRREGSLCHLGRHGERRRTLGRLRRLPQAAHRSWG